MISLSILALALFPFALAQSDNSSSVQIEAIEAHFNQSGIVPSLLTSFQPSALLAFNFDGVGDVKPGQALTQEQVASAPTINVTVANSSEPLDGNYTLTMVDAGPVGGNITAGVTRHWLVNGVTFSGSSLSNATATAITTYAGPAPPSGTGPHRYVIILYAQPPNFSPPEGFSTPNIGVSVFDLNAYVKASNLGDIVAANYMTVEEGTATASISPTSAVVSSTLSASPSKTPGSSSASGPGASQSPSSGAESLSLGRSLMAMALSGFMILIAA